MSKTVYDLEKTVSAGLQTAIRKSKIKYGQLSVEVDINNLSSTILYLKTKLLNLNLLL